MQLPILLYHSISEHASAQFRRWSIPPALFAEQMDYLASQGYNPLTITRLAQSLRDHSLPLPERPVAITFDDALADFVSQALPILQKVHFPSTLYVPTAFIGLQGSWLRQLSEGDRPLMSWDDLRAAEQSGVEIGSHSHTHPQMDTLSEKQAWYEITTSKALLENQLGHPVNTFAYPHGYHSALTCWLVKKAGFTSACAVKHSLSSSEDDPLALARIIISPDQNTLEKFDALIQGRGLRPLVVGERLETRIWRFIRQSSAHLRKIS